MKPNTLLYLLLVVILGAPSFAKAKEDVPFSFESSAHTYMITGLTTGASFGSGSGGYLGWEYGLSRVDKGVWKGVYGDVFYDFGQRATTITLGPTVGFLVFGLDGGLGIRMGVEQQAETGFQVRGMISLGVLSLYYRYGGWPGEQGLRSVNQIGVSFRAPLYTSYKPRPTAP